MFRYSKKQIVLTSFFFLFSIFLTSAKIKVISFDCAQTLIDVNWDLAPVVVETAKEWGYSIKNDENAKQAFYEVLIENPALEQSIKASYSNKRAKANKLQWISLMHQWLGRAGFSDSWWSWTTNWIYAPFVMKTAYKNATCPGSPLFKLFDGVIPILESLKQSGYKLIIISNWNDKLPDILKHLNISHYFDEIIVSEIVGIDKPDKEIFNLALNELNKIKLDPLNLGCVRLAENYKMDEILHVGDSRSDDYEAAKKAGMHAIIIDHKAKESNRDTICSFTELRRVISEINIER